MKFPYKAKIKDNFAKVRDLISRAYKLLIPSYATFMALLSQGELLKWTENLTKSTATVYDKALDATHNKTPIGGGNHRLFDKSHDIFNAWDKAKNARPDDSFFQEVIGFCQAILKDVTTTRGLPFMTLDKASYNQWAEKISESIPFVSKDYLYDLMSFDALEVFSSVLGAVAAIFFLNKNDQEKLSEILGAMGITSIISANPLMGIMTVAIAGYSYYKKKRELDKIAAFKSGTIAAFSFGLFTVLGFSFLVEIVIVIVVANLFKDKVLNNKDILDIIRRHTKEVMAYGNKQSEKVLKLLNSLLINYSKNPSAPAEHLPLARGG